METHTMRRIRVRLLVIIVIAIAVFAACSDSPDDSEILAQIAVDGWQMIEGGEDTMCAHGEDYHFFARTGSDSKNVVVYFQAGGACWSVESCLANNPVPIYDQTVTTGEFSWYRGIFDLNNPENPLRDFDMLFVPLCTGDAHIGDATVTYRTAADLIDLTIHHNGYRNTTSALNWLYEQYPDPERIWVIGSSAGSLASLYYYPDIVEQYPQSQVSLFGDGYLGVFPRGWDAMQRWNIQANLPTEIPGIDTLDILDFSITDLMLAATAFYPDAQFAIYSHAADAFQVAYYGATGGDMTQWHVERQKVLDAYESQPNLNYYMGEGVLHTVLAFDEFYTMTTEGVRFRDWFAQFIEQQPLENVSCKRGTVFCP